MNITLPFQIPGITFHPISLNPGGWLAWAVVALLAGWLAGHLVRGRGFGCLGDILLGLIGAVVGIVVLSAVPTNALPFASEQPLGFLGSLVVAFLGAFLLALIGRMLGGSGRSYREWSR
ncbi:MAG TPA: GlsB/YeaQ/YmgE family stress response membrane protein [Ktedonobacterales bacterium]|jgi:uncharacterized membrane protein YeaQ/YmgE (transglycosylase-associated protein family)|nr:GlsB/YeaQ/YmgE family stress response membrane protein [Ktedonobacterales bacterium]